MSEVDGGDDSAGVDGDGKRDSGGKSDFEETCIEIGLFSSAATVPPADTSFERHQGVPRQTDYAP